MYSHCINVCVLSTILALRLKMNELVRMYLTGVSIVD
jgi:HD-GYP domain-containing protein (c-di-GMP phosphodiesterase class II)